MVANGELVNEELDATQVRKKESTIFSVTTGEEVLRKSNPSWDSLRLLRRSPSLVRFARKMLASLA
jgi:hypothetical protein